MLMQKVAKIAEALIRLLQRENVILGRDHHDVSGTDSPYRETSNIYDGSRLPLI
jgi:urocanate hydratase